MCYDVCALCVNVQERAASFVNTCEKRSEWYLTDHLLIPFGNDFAFKDAPQHFKKMDEIIQYINSHKEASSHKRVWLTAKIWDVFRSGVHV